MVNRLNFELCDIYYDYPDIASPAWSGLKPINTPALFLWVAWELEWG